MRSLIFVLVLLASSVFAAPLDKRQDACGGFRITSPTQSGLQWTHGQCYQISFDAGNNSAGALQVTSVDLLDVAGNLVKTQWSGSVDPALQGYVPFFNLDLGPTPTTGTYSFRVNVHTSGGATCVRNTVSITGIFNPNSGFVPCPAS
ncbi:5760_t:CDS:2 [Ambispora gerdemannii]|uniref:5760_t:CDS:1 n=1 Tax=Ambispora gerdemannii TaxID=144530 RepID=A0A9N9B2M1_9GLOM|nr:5760_t:CDS:2 [Ambispora gerdemannii]